MARHSSCAVCWIIWAAVAYFVYEYLTAAPAASSSPAAAATTGNPAPVLISAATGQPNGTRTIDGVTVSVPNGNEIAFIAATQGVAPAPFSAFVPVPGGSTDQREITSDSGGYGAQYQVVGQVSTVTFPGNPGSVINSQIGITPGGLAMANPGVNLAGAYGYNFNTGTYGGYSPQYVVQRK